MASSLSKDLRVRVIRAVEEEGMSRRQAAARFGVGVATAIRWLAVWQRTGRAAAKPMGDDRHSHRIEVHAGFLLGEIERQPDITLAELQERLRQERSVRVAISTLWRFFNRRRMTHKNVWPAPLAT